MQNMAVTAHPPLQSLAQYQASLSTGLYSIKLDLGGPEESFRASFSERRVGALRLFKVYANSGFECFGHASSCAEDACYLLQLQAAGGTAYTHRGLNVVCNTGSLILMDPRKTIVGTQFGAADALIVGIPVRMLAGIAPRVADYCSAPVDSSSGSASILAAMIKDFWTWHASLTAYDHQVLPDTLLRLTSAVFSNKVSEAGQAQGHRTSQFKRLQCAVSANLHDPALSVDLLCQMLGMSRSTLFALTRTIGTTVERMIVEARLAAVEARLGDARYAGVSVTDIAFNAGFQDLSHFSRRFKQKYGASPAQYRMARMAPGR